jgi:hypothetical protein
MHDKPKLIVEERFTEARISVTEKISNGITVIKVRGAHDQGAPKCDEQNALNVRFKS